MIVKKIPNPLPYLAFFRPDHCPKHSRPYSSPFLPNDEEVGKIEIKGILHSCSLRIVFMKRVYYNDMTQALASVIFIIVNEFHKNDMQ